jgi:hypothetical protein
LDRDGGFLGEVLEDFEVEGSAFFVWELKNRLSLVFFGVYGIGSEESHGSHLS